MAQCQDNMNIDKKLIVSALEIYKAFLVKRDVSEHDQTLEILIKVNEQIKLIKEWKKQMKNQISGSTTV